MNNRKPKPSYRLVIRQDILLRGFVRLASGEAEMMWGEIIRSYHSLGCDLIVRELAYSNSLPSGEAFSPLFDWIVIHRPDDVGEETIRSRILASNIRFGQLMVYFQPGNGDSFQDWIGAVVEHQRILPLNDINLVGPGLHRIRRNRAKSQPGGLPAKPADQVDLWSRITGAMGDKVFFRFRQIEIVLIGCGRLGSLIAIKLIRMGLKRITLVDPDRLLPHNRDMTVGNHPSDIGQNKAIVLANGCHRIRPKARIIAVDRPAQDNQVLDHLRRAPVLVTCVDNDETRRYVSRIAVELLRVHLDVGTIIASTQNSQQPADQSNQRIIAADLRLALPGTCLFCIGGLQHDDAPDLNDESSWKSGGRIGSLPSINSIAAGTALQIYFDFLAERIQHSFWQRIRWNDTQGLSAAAATVYGDRNCPICGSRKKLVGR